MFRTRQHLALLTKLTSLPKQLSSINGFEGLYKTTTDTPGHAQYIPVIIMRPGLQCSSVTELAGVLATVFSVVTLWYVATSTSEW